MRISRQLFITVCLLAGYMFSASAATAAIINAASCSRTDVNTAITTASAGDTVQIPACGDTAWTSGVTINKSLTIRGAGITSGSSLTSLTGTAIFFTVAPTTNVPVRITAIAMAHPVGGTEVDLYGIGTGLTQIRVDHCKFTNGSRTVRINGWAYGLIDHNEFINGDIAIGFVADNSSWARPIQAGTANAMFIEDNTFTTNNSAPSDLDETIYIQEGGRAVIRYNTFAGTAYTAYNGLPFDGHGNQNYYDGSGDFRGQPIMEFYNNIVNVHHTYRIMHIRSGSLLIHNNTFTTVTGTPPVIQLNEEETWQTLYFSPLDTTWPCEDQIYNSFFWNNTLNGSPVTSVAFSGPSGSVIAEGRDYFFHEPQSSGGYEYYTNRPGASGRGTDGTLAFSPTGANAYYPYTPYIYPHPLVTGTSSTDLSPPAAPSNLKVQ